MRAPRGQPCGMARAPVNCGAVSHWHAGRGAARCGRAPQSRLAGHGSCRGRAARSRGSVDHHGRGAGGAHGPVPPLAHRWQADLLNIPAAHHDLDAVHRAGDGLHLPTTTGTWWPRLRKRYQSASLAGLICESSGLKVAISMACTRPRMISAARSHCGSGARGITTRPFCQMHCRAHSAMVTSWASPMADSDGPPVHKG